MRNFFVPKTSEVSIELGKHTYFLTAVFVGEVRSSSSEECAASAQGQEGFIIRISCHGCPRQIPWRADPHDGLEKARENRGIACKGCACTASC